MNDDALSLFQRAEVDSSLFLRLTALDLVRLLASVSPALAAYRSPSSSTIVQVVLAAAEWNKPWEATKERETNTMLAFRVLANLFSTKNGKQALLSEPGCEEVSCTVAHCSPRPSRWDSLTGFIVRLRLARPSSSKASSPDPPTMPSTKTSESRSRRSCSS